jgi:hypothetical protein
VKKKKGLTKAEVQFCTSVARGDKPIKACLIEAYPRYKNASKNTVETQAKRLVQREDIVRKIAEIKANFAKAVETADVLSKTEALEMMTQGIREGVKNEPMAIVEFAAMLKLMGQWCGWEAPKDVNIRNGGYTADYKGPPTLMEMSDEELDAKLEDMRGGK